MNRSLPWMIAGLLVSCGSALDDRHGELQRLNATQALERANDWRDDGSLASRVTSQAVEFEFADGRRHSVPLPADRMVVSLAPYVEHTHPCETHSMSGCQGELVRVPLHVRVIGTDGQAVLDRTLITQDNGFIDLWLPRGGDFTVVVQGERGRAEERIGTHEQSPTCITTLQLQPVVQERSG